MSAAGAATFNSSVTSTGLISSSLLNSANNSLTILGGGSATNNGANLTLYGGSAEASAGDFRFRNGTTETARITAAGAATFNGTVETGGTLYIPQWIEHSGDSNTYFGFPSGDEFKVVTANVGRLHIKGSESVWNEGGANVDFRVESDTRTHMLFVDASTNRVAVGTNAPVGLGLTVNGGTSAGTYFYGGTNNRRQLSFTSFDTASLDAGHEITASSVSGRLLLSAASVNHIQLDAVSNTTVFNEGGTDQDFRVESERQR